jgi:hypothetical protein
MQNYHLRTPIDAEEEERRNYYRPTASSEASQ